MNNDQKLPIPVKGQYALWQIIGIWLAGGAPIWLLGWIVYPAMSLSRADLGVCAGDDHSLFRRGQHPAEYDLPPFLAEPSGFGANR